MAKKRSEIYLCSDCGNEFSVWSGKCPACGEWNTLKEVKGLDVALASKRSSHREIEVKNIAEISLDKAFRIKTTIDELDRVLGGGIVPGSVILLGGEPGIGKSTLLLQVVEKIKDTLYLSAEESAAQIKIRADRLKMKNKSISVVADGDIEAVAKEIQKNRPALLVVDSIQTVYLGSYDATPGSIVQVRECGMYLQQLAKSTGIPIIIVGHVTKEGNLAGPRILEHLVDVVLYLEGERFSDARILRGVKNRFGATNEVGIFSMQGEGLVEIKNPSEMFLAERRSAPGSVVTVTLEGTRPILIEIQALVIPTHFGYPKRTSSGFDLNRLNLLAAVISKKTSIDLSNSDVYLNVIGGLKLSEPAVDLAVCAAIMSSYKNKVINTNTCLFGEVGLLGEVRRVTRQKDREAEAIHLGYTVPEKIAEITEILKLL